MPPRPETATRHQDSLGFQIWRVRSGGRMPAPHTHADIEINFLFPGGRVRYLHAGVRQEIAGGRLAVLWGGVPHQILAPGIEGSGIWLTFPLAWLLQWRLPGDLNARLLAGDIAQGPPDEGDAAMLERWHADFHSGSTERRRALLLELEARLVRLAAEQRSSRRARKSGDESRGGIGHIERVTGYLARHYGEAVTIEAVGRAVSLHPNYLMRLFKRECRLSVWEYLTRLRVAHAQRLLVTTDRKIADVALESGFGSVPAFYQNFGRHANGLAPRAYRQRHRVGPPTEAPLIRRAT